MELAVTIGVAVWLFVSFWRSLPGITSPLSWLVPMAAFLIGFVLLVWRLRLVAHV